jgi:DNA-binding NarL/FixJ family response regulator
MSPDRVEEETHEAIILIDDEPFTQECVIEALRGSFPQAAMIGISSVEDLYRPDGMSVSLVLINAKTRPLVCEVLASEIKVTTRQFPRTPVVLISVQDDDTVICDAIAAGVQGVIPVTASLRIAVAALHLVMAGVTYYPRPVLNHVPLHNGTGANGHADAHDSSPISSLSPAPMTIGGIGSPSDVNHDMGLPAALRINGFPVTFTTREAEVLAALQRGRSNKWIANHLNLSQNTIKVHIRHIMRKLHATNRTEAVILSQRFKSDMHQPSESTAHA